MFSRIAVLSLLVLSFACGDRMPGASDLFLPDDLQVELWAASPLCYNPTNIDIDERGRVWVTEAVNYRRFNNDTAAAPFFPEGDRVMILEDTNADGRADISRVFVQDPDLVAPLGIGVIGNKVYVSCSPHLIVYTDENGDDRPDHKEILLTGFGGKDHDHALHALTGGPDGLLYFNVGNAGPHVVTDKSGWTLRAGSLYTGGSPYNRKNQGNMRSDDGKVYVGGLALRMDTTGSRLRVLGHNFRNAFELAVDSRGDLWQSDNDDQVLTCRTTWLMEGGNAGYFSADGTRYWQADQRPGQDLFTAHWHQEDPGVIPAGDNFGAGSPTGVALNEGDGLGEAYRGMLLIADAGRNVIFGYRPRISGSGYDLSDRINLLTSLEEDNTLYVWHDSAFNSKKQSWFRPSDVAIGTDGAMYVSDWYDPIVGGHQMRDSAGYGRIYRITRRGENPKPPRYDMHSPEGLIKALASPAVNVRFSALLGLQRRGGESVHAVSALLSDANPFIRDRAIWALSLLGEEGIQKLRELLNHTDAEVRTVAFRALRRDTANLVRYAFTLKNDPSAFVRRELILALRHVPWAEARPILLELMEQFDGEDRWYLEALGMALEDHASEIFAGLLRRYSVPGAPPASWDSRFRGLLWRLHPPESVPLLQAWATAVGIAPAERRRALTALAFVPTREAAKTMLALRDHADTTVSADATYWLAFRHGNDWHELLDWGKLAMNPAFERKLREMQGHRDLLLDQRLPVEQKDWYVRVMARDSVGGQLLLGMLAEDLLQPELKPYVQQHIFQNPDMAVRIQAAQYFPQPGGETSYLIPEILNMTGSPGRGAQLFETKCGTCHTMEGRGRDLGPDLSRIGGKLDTESLLDAIIHPSAGIVFGYEPWLIQTREGASYYGFLVADGEKTVVIKDLAGQRHVLSAADIRSRRRQQTSLMPDPATLGLSPQELADIAAFLSAKK